MRIPGLVCGLVLAATAAHACDKPVDLTNQQVKDGINTLTSTEAADFEKVFAYEELACAARDTVRQLADTNALEHGGPALQSVVLKRVLMERQSLTLEIIDDGNLTDEQIEYARKTPSWPYAFQFWDSENSCISLYSTTTCTPGRSIDIRQTGINIYFFNTTAELTLDEGGMLVGFFVPEGGGLKLPVQARLF